MNRLLIIEDDSSLALNLKEFLQSEGYSVDHAATLKQAKERGCNYDCIILDWTLTDGQGIDYLRGLRAQGIWVPVLFLTAKADLIDKVLGLESGAHDYLTKPFEPRELLARLRVHLRKKTLDSELLQACEMTLDLQARTVQFLGIFIETTRKEFDLLALMLTHPQRVFTREELLNKVWGFENYPTTRTVDTHVLQLRQKTRDDFIQTVRGVGYRLNQSEKLTTN